MVFFISSIFGAGCLMLISVLILRDTPGINKDGVKK